MVGLYFTQLGNWVMLRLILCMLHLGAHGTFTYSFVVGSGVFKSSMLELSLELNDLEAENRF